MTEHAHPPVVKIWFILLGLLSISLIAGLMNLPYLVNIIVFGVAISKTLIVMRYYMGLKVEPFFISMIIVGAFTCLLILFVLLVPDIVGSV